MPVSLQIINIVTGHANGAQQRGLWGKITNMMTYLIKYPFQQKGGWGGRTERKKKGGKDQNTDIEEAVERE